MKLAFSVTDSTHIQKIEAEGLKLLNELQSFIPLLRERVTFLLRLHAKELGLLS